MADVNKFIPFILRWAAGVNLKSGESVESLFERAKRTGWSDHPLDRGGATQCDVTLSTYINYCKRKGKPKPTKEKLRNVLFSEWREILKEYYWDIWKGDQIWDQSIAEILVDWVWGSGAKSIPSAQRVIGTEPDGKVGERTLHAINTADSQKLFKRLLDARIEYVNAIVKRNPSQKIWLKGWVNRINSIQPPKNITE